jgi:hypothetical protein
MSLADVEAQNMDFIRSPPSPCSYSADNATELLACLRRLSGKAVANLLPASFDASTVLPQNRTIEDHAGRPTQCGEGQRQVGLPAADGVLLHEGGLLAALRARVNDVPLLVQVMLAETDLLVPNQTIYNMSKDEYSGFLRQFMRTHGWSEAAAEQVAVEQYANESAISTELAYQSFMTDYDMHCGNAEVAITAAAAFSSPVYFSVGMHSPGNKFVLDQEGFPVLKYPGHQWDIIAATRAWGQFSEPPGAPVYKPTASDISWGQQMAAQWFELAKDGKISSSAPGAAQMQTIDSAPGFPNNINVALQTDKGVEMTLNYKVARCKALAAEPLGLGPCFWSVN